MNDSLSAVSIVDNLLSKASLTYASDIHLEPLKARTRVRFRIDGLLYEESFIDEPYSSQVNARIKVLAHMNIAEKRIPQDGKFSYNLNSREIDLRVATFPCVFGEKIVIRILDQVANRLDLNNLGFSPVMLDTISNLARKSHGFFLVTGPTGSGKTTTLHAMLSCVKSIEKNISTLEDPIEYTIDGINQAQIHPEIGFTFAKGIKSLLRQDPDIIMVGEIRDKETAQVAIQAALTGHLVLSTLHTTNATGALMRLLEMEIEPFLINSSLTGILAQRLARKLCTVCRFKANFTSQEEALLKNLDIALQNCYKSEGCNECRYTGYKGRVGIFELLVVSSNLQALLTKRPLFKLIQNQVREDGLIPLVQDGAEKINAGITSICELVRVVS